MYILDSEVGGIFENSTKVSSTKNPKVGRMMGGEPKEIKMQSSGLEQEKIYFMQI